MKARFVLTLVFLYSHVLHAKVSAVIEAWDTRFVIPSENNLTITEFLRVKILEEDGYDHAVYKTYYNSFRKIKSLKYTIYDANNNKVKKYTKYDALDIMINPSYAIGDARMVVLNPEYRSYPFTVEIEVEIAYNGFLDFPVWMPRYAADIEVKKATLLLETYDRFEYRSLELNGVGSPAISLREDVKIVKWTLANLSAAGKHLSNKLFEAAQPKVHIAPVKFSLDNTRGNFNTWTDFGEWFIALNEGRNVLRPDTKTFLDDLTRQYPNDPATISKIVYQFMQSKTRYISIQLGIGGFQTIPADEVESTGYGDCKALTNYMKSMLDYLKIPCNYVLVNAGKDEPDILYDFPSNQFNHVFLAVPLSNDTLWYECTSQTLPPGYIGTFTDDRHVLWVSKGSSQMVRTPVYSAGKNMIKRTGTVHMEPNGDAFLTLQISQTGIFFDESMIYQGAPKDYVDNFNFNKFSYKDFSIKDFNFKIPDPNTPIMNLSFKVRVNALGRQLGNKLILPLNLLTPVDKDLATDILNKQCEIRRAFTIEDELRLQLPENFRLNYDPGIQSEDSDFGSLKIEIRADGQNGINIYRKVTIKKGVYERELFDKFYESVKKFRTIEQDKIVLISKT